VTLAANSTPAGGIRTSGFTGYSTDVDFRTDGTGTIDPNQAQRFSGSTAGFLDFIFATTPMTGGTESQFVFIKTTATTYNDSGLTDISADSGAGQTGISSQFATYAPGTVPEPTTLMVLPAIAVVAGLRRRRLSKWEAYTSSLADDGPGEAGKFCVSNCRLHVGKERLA
jgi:hypothetical protein